MSIVLWAQEAVLLMLGLYWTVWDRYMQVLYLGRALRTKENLPDFLKWRRVTRHPLVFRGLTGSQRTPGLGRHTPSPSRPFCRFTLCSRCPGDQTKKLVTTIGAVCGKSNKKVSSTIGKSLAPTAVQ